MAPSSTLQILLSPAELSYLHTSLSQHPPIRPDARSASQFRPLVAETDILPGTNGSARICFADGTEAIVGIKAEVERSRTIWQEGVDLAGNGGENDDIAASEGSEKGLNEWVEFSVEVPGFRDDDSMPVFLSAMLSEALLADGEFTKRLWINRRFHWKLYLDVNPLSLPRYLNDLETNYTRFYCSRNLCPILSPSYHSQHTSHSSLPGSQNSNPSLTKIRYLTTIGMLLLSYTLEQQEKHGADRRLRFLLWL